MSVYRLNIISRIADDKNFFIDILYAVYRLRSKHNINIEVFFIGQIYNQSIYNTLQRFSHLIGINDLVYFTKCSIPLSQVENRKCDYFLNFSVGKFFGYSGLESIRLGFKTIFYNIDPLYSFDCNSFITCKDNNDLVDFFVSLDSNSDFVTKKVIEENLSMAREVEFDSLTSNALLSII